MNFFQQATTYIYVFDAFYPHSLYLHCSSQKRIYTTSYCFTCNQHIFMPATKGVYVRPSYTLPAANVVYIRYIRPHKVTFHKCLIVWCIFLWLISYICKPLDIIEIISNCNINNQGRIYTSTLQAFPKTLVTEVYWDSYATKKRICMGKASQDCRRHCIAKQIRQNCLKFQHSR